MRTKNKIDMNEYFPSGEIIPAWFYNEDNISLDKLGTIYPVSSNSSTKEVQSLADLIYEKGGGVLYFAKGTYLLGAIYLKSHVHIYLEKGAVIFGSEDINDFPLTDTRIEGECCQYYPALINIVGSKKTYIFGEGTINGQGLGYWKLFWLNQKNMSGSTNKDTHRPRLLYAYNSENIYINGITFKDSPFWTTHFYKCKNIKIINSEFYSPKEPVPAPSTDGIDLDVCENVLIKNCYFAVNDDAIALKGGKGTFADLDKSNGPNKKIIIENCKYGFCQSALAFGSESIFNKDIILKDVEFKNILQGIHFKMRVDTPQHFENILIKGLKGSIIGSFLNINPWNQYSNLKERKDKPISKINNVTFMDIDISCGCFFNVLQNDEHYLLSNFDFNHLNVVTNDKGLDYHFISNINLSNVNIKEK